MSKFTATQYEHFRMRTRWFVKNAIDSIKEPDQLDKDEKVSLVLAGKAKVDVDKVQPKDGSCPYHLNDFLEFFSFPGDSVRSQKKAAYNRKIEKIKTAIENKIKDMTDRYVVGVIDGDGFMAELKALEKKYIK